MAGEIQLNGTTALTESSGAVTLNNVNSATNRTNLGLGTAATSATGDFEASGAVSTHAAVTSGVHGISAFGGTLVDDADAAAARTTLGLGTAATSNTSAFEASGSVSTHAAVTSGVHGISAFGATLVDDANAATARTTLGLGTAATSASTDFVGASRTITAGTGLSGGGDLSTNRTINVSFSSNESNVKTALNASGSAPIYACRAWVNFNGTGTAAIRDSGNVSSITDNTTGDYIVHFATAMPDANYVVVLGSAQISSSRKIVANEQEVSNNNKLTTSFRIRTGYANGSSSSIDTDGVYVAIFR